MRAHTIAVLAILATLIALDAARLLLVESGLPAWSGGPVADRAYGVLSLGVAGFVGAVLSRRRLALTMSLLVCCASVWGVVVGARIAGVAGHAADYGPLIAANAGWMLLALAAALAGAHGGWRLSQRGKAAPDA